MGQSVPNPHGSQCTIPYSIDANVINAEIDFVDELGRVVQSVEIVTRGKGQLTVLSSNLEDGVYNYSLVLDGKMLVTKRMIKQH
ncbi:MAG: T9SS type A sorting domain-containing protein [Chitinophagales bacterium]|nr:T9SS type A sorting domain-containing protein [Chitinophagales bacterium]